MKEKAIKKKLGKMKNKEYTIHELLKLATWQKVWRSFQYFFSMSEKSQKWFKGQYLRLRRMKPKNKVKKNERIQIRVRKDRVDFPDSPNLWEGQWRDIFTNQYSMSFRDWNELIALKVSRNTEKNYTDNEIVAIFLYEVTFYGSEDESKREGKKIFTRVAEAKKQILKEGRKQTKIV